MTDYDAGSPPVQQAFDPNDPSLFVDAPKWPKVVGILSIVFGSIAVFCTGMSAVFAPLQGGMVEQLLDGDPTPPHMVLGPLDWGLMGTGVFANITLIIAGSMCVSRKIATRPAHLFYAVLIIAGTIFGSWVHFQKQAALEQWLQDYPNNQFAQQMATQQQMQSTMGLIVLAVFVLISLAWPTFCLIWFGVNKTKASDLTGAPAQDDSPYAPGA